MDNALVLPTGVQSPATVTKKVEEFLKNFQPYERSDGRAIHLFLDEKSNAFYITCHLRGDTLAESCDTEATLDGDEEDEIYKLNREILEDQAAYQTMEKDAISGRSFEDIVLEYDTSYTSRKPLKVYGGQHRIKSAHKGEDSEAYNVARRQDLLRALPRTKGRNSDDKQYGHRCP